MPEIIWSRCAIVINRKLSPLPTYPDQAEALSCVSAFPFVGQAGACGPMASSGSEQAFSLALFLKESSHLSSPAQNAANRANAQLSTGPISFEGKQAVSQNNLRHGLAGDFHLLAWENGAEFETLTASLHAEHNPQTATEHILVGRLVQHEWLRRRALHLQNLCFNADGMIDEEKKFGLYLRYQTSHERAFHKCLSELLKLRAERRKQQIGFESQKAKQADQERKQELHEARTRLANAKAAHLEFDTDIKSTIEAILPGHTPVSFDQVKGVLKLAIEEVFGPRSATRVT
jgi:hypothetical protein